MHLDVEYLISRRMRVRGSVQIVRQKMGQKLRVTAG